MDTIEYNILKEQILKMVDACILLGEAMIELTAKVKEIDKRLNKLSKKVERINK